MLGLLNTVLTRGGSLLTYVKDGLVMANRFLTPPKITHPAQGSAEFNGTSDYIDLPSDILTNFSNFTFSGWYYLNASSGNNTMLGFGNSTTDTPIANFDFNSSNGNVVAYYRDDSGTNVSTTGSVEYNKWIFATYTKEGNNIYLYLDGSLISSNTGSVNSNPTFNTLKIGALERTSLINNWEGNLANVAIWNRALSSDEINSVMWKSYEGLNDSEENGLQAWYSLDDITSPAASLANMEQLAADKDATIENKAAITAAVNALS